MISPSIFASAKRTLRSCSSKDRNSRSTAARNWPRSVPGMALRTETSLSLIHIYLLSVPDEFDPRDQFRRDLEAEMDFGPDNFVQRLLYRGALLRWQGERAANNGGLGCRLQGFGEASLGRTFHFPQPVNEHVAHARFKGCLLYTSRCV